MKFFADGIAKRQIAAAVGVVLWSLLLSLGYNLISNAVPERVASGVDERLVLYVWIPLGAVLIGLLLFVLGRKVPLVAFLLIYGTIMVSFVPVLMLFGGGV